MSGHRLSAIIPTRDRPELLADALRSLMVQTRHDLEVVVVDDGSECDLESVVDGVAGPIPIRYVHQEPAGLNVGRNTGAGVATGDLLAFLDDDTIVSPVWADSMLRAVSTGCAGIAGRIQLWFEDACPDWLTAELRPYLSELDLGPGPVVLATGQTPYGANCAVRREWFHRVGGFRTGLDRNGASLVSNGDVEFFRRVRDAGGSLIYWPAAAVLHRVPEHRLRREFFLERAFAQGVSDVLLERARTAKPPTAPRELAARLRVVPSLVKGVSRGRGTLNAACWWSYSRGRARAAREVA